MIIFHTCSITTSEIRELSQDLFMDKQRNLIMTKISSDIHAGIIKVILQKTDSAENSMKKNNNI
jgi:hypothetical protein